MALENFANDPATTLAAGATASSALVIVTGQGGFPAAAPFRVLVVNPDGSYERIRVNSVSGTTWGSLDRGLEGTTPIALSSGANVYGPPTAAQLTAFMTPAAVTAGSGIGVTATDRGVTVANLGVTSLSDGSATAHGDLTVRGGSGVIASLAAGVMTIGLSGAGPTSAGALTYKDFLGDAIQTGLAVTATGGLVVQVQSGVAYVGGIRASIGVPTNITIPATPQTSYIEWDGTHAPVSSTAAAPTVGSIRLATVTTDGVSAVTSVTPTASLAPLGSYVDARRYGLVTNSAADQTATLNTIFAAAVAGTAIEIPSGTYYATDLTIPPGPASIMLKGSGKGVTTIKALPGTNVMLTVNNTLLTNVMGHVQDFTLDGQGIANYGLVISDNGALRTSFFDIEATNITGQAGTLFPTFLTTLMAPAHVGDTTIAVGGVGTLIAAQVIQINGGPGIDSVGAGHTGEAVTVTTASGTTISCTPLLNAYPAGTPVSFGGTDRFGNLITGVGLCNIDHAWGTDWRRLWVHDNRYGSYFCKRIQQSSWTNCMWFRNTCGQVIIGEGSFDMDVLRFTGCQFQMSFPTFAQDNVLVNRGFIHFDSTYFESQGFPGSCDIRVTGTNRTPSVLTLTNTFSTGNLIAQNSIIADTKMLLTINGGNWTTFNGRIVRDNSGVSQIWGMNDEENAGLFRGPYSRNAGISALAQPAGPATTVVSAPSAGTPSAPTAVLRSDNTAGQIPVGPHAYKATFVYPGGETAVSAASNSVTSDATHTSTTVTIPASTDTTVTARNIYRNTVADPTIYGLLATVADNVAATWTDTHPDADVGAAQAVPGPGVLYVADTFGFVPGARVIIGGGWAAGGEVNAINNVQPGVSLTLQNALNTTYTNQLVRQGLGRTDSDVIAPTAAYNGALAVRGAAAAWTTTARTAYQVTYTAATWGSASTVVNPANGASVAGGLSVYVTNTAGFSKGALISIGTGVYGSGEKNIIAIVNSATQLILANPLTNSYTSGAVTQVANSAIATTVNASSAAGQKSLAVASVSGFIVGMVITIGTGAGAGGETNLIADIPAGGTSLTMATALANTYTSQTVTQSTTIPFVAGSAVAITDIVYSDQGELAGGTAAGANNYNTAGGQTCVVTAQTAQTITIALPRVVGTGKAEPAVAALNSDSATGQITTGPHSYKITYVTDFGETLASLASNSVPNDESHTSTTVTLPIGADGSVTGRNVYRNTVAAPSVWGLLTSITDNTTGSWVDRHPDADVGVPPPTSGAGSRVFYRPGTYTSGGVISGNVGLPWNLKAQPQVGGPTGNTLSFLAPSGSTAATLRDDGLWKPSLGQTVLVKSAGAPLDTDWAPALTNNENGAVVLDTSIAPARIWIRDFGWAGFGGAGTFSQLMPALGYSDAFADGFVRVSALPTGNGSGVITAALWSKTTQTITFTTSAPHGLLSGQTVVVGGVSPSAFNGVYTVLATGLTATQFAVTLTTSPGSYTSGGGVSGYYRVPGGLAMYLTPSAVTSTLAAGGTKYQLSGAVYVPLPVGSDGTWFLDWNGLNTAAGFGWSQAGTPATDYARVATVSWTGLAGNAATMTLTTTNATAGIRFSTQPVSFQSAVSVATTGTVIPITGASAVNTAQAKLTAAASGTGSPSGTHTAGELYVDSVGTLWQCTSGGTPGTWVNLSAAGGGTVTSVAMTGDGTVFNSAVTGSPVTGAGTFAPSLKTQSANLVFAGPTSGGAAAPGFRALVSADFGSAVVPDSALSTNVGLLNTAQTATALKSFSTTQNNAPRRLVPPAAGTGAPVSNAHTVGEEYIDSAGSMFLCSAAGTPGTWAPRLTTRPTPADVGPNTNYLAWAYDPIIASLSGLLVTQTPVFTKLWIHTTGVPTTICYHTQTPVASSLDSGTTTVTGGRISAAYPHTFVAIYNSAGQLLWFYGAATEFTSSGWHATAISSGSSIAGGFPTLSAGDYVYLVICPMGTGGSPVMPTFTAAGLSGQQSLTLMNQGGQYARTGKLVFGAPKPQQGGADYTNSGTGGGFGTGPPDTFTQSADLSTDGNAGGRIWFGAIA